MTRDQRPLQASAIRQAVCSTTTCSEVTVEGLKCLLNLNSSKIDVANAASKKIKATKVPTLPIRPIAKRSKLRSAIAVVEVHQDIDEHLEARDKVKLATDVVNTALKGLTDATKAPALPKPSKKRTSLSRTTSGQSTQSSTPLQARCANRPPGAPNTSNESCGSLRSLSISCESPNQGVVALATCAREALAFLRRWSSEVEGHSQSSPIQIESGMSALISKLIGLGLDDLATKELRILLKRLCGMQEDSAARLLNSVPKQQTLSDLLIVKETPRDAARLALLVTSQLQVLRLIAARKRPATVEAALDHLQFSNPHSPVSLLQQAASQGTPGICEKAARQLESFAQVLQSLVARPSIGQSSESKDPHTLIASHIAVEYQLLVLKIRVIWWSMIDHHVDAQKELLMPFSSVILAFNQRSNWSPSKKHDYCSAACARFLALLESKSHDQSLLLQLDEIQSMKCDIYHIIADSARNALCPSDALNYLDKCLDLSKTLKRSQTSICAILCQMLSVELKIKTGMQESTASHLESLVNALQSNISGESSELDDFLLRAVQLQRLVLTTLFGPAKVENTDSFAEQLEKFHSAGFTYILECSLFLKRYLGKRPDSRANIRHTARFAERKSIIGKVAIPVIESVAGLARMVSPTDVANWRRLDSTISGCRSLMIEYENTENGPSVSSSSERANTTHWRQMISNIYWSRFLGLKQQSATFESVLGSLLTSITLLEECPIIGQLQSQMCTRLDRLSALYESKGKWAEAKATYLKTLNIQVTADCMICAATFMSKKPLSVVLQDQDLTMWNRTIAAFSRTLRKDGSKDQQFKAYDKEDAPCSVRGMILEQQLAIVESTWFNTASAQALKSVLDALAHSLLEVYKPHRYPLRRMRVMLSLLRVELTAPGALTEATRDEILQDPLPSFLEKFEEDRDLSKYDIHLMASIELARNFLGGDPSAVTCQKVLDAWKSMIRSTSGNLMSHVDDIPSWIKLLRMLAEYFGMQGLEAERAETLHICSIVQECEPEMSIDGQSMCQMNLCLQLLDLGHSGKASLPLQRVRQHLTNAEFQSGSKFQWHIASATHELQIGSQSEW